MKKVCWLWICLSVMVYGQAFYVYTEQLPPFNFTQNDKVVGSSTKLLETLLHQSGHTIAHSHITLTSWSRGYHEALNTPNTILYSMARTLEREHLFKWVGPIDTLTIGLIAKKSAHVVIKEPQDLHRYTIAVMHDSAAESLLLKLGLQTKQLERFTNATSQLKKLQDKRVDAMASSVEAMYAMLNSEGLDPLEYETVYVLKQSDLYFAFHKETDDEIIEALNHLLQKIKP